MALSPLLLKSLFGCVSVAGIGTAASFTIYQTYFPSPDGKDQSLENGKHSDADKSSDKGTSSTLQKDLEDTISVAVNPVVLVAVKTPLTTESQLTVNTTGENYKCQLAGDTSTPDFCRLVKLDVTNNWIDVNGIKKATSFDTVKLTDLNAEDHHFKLEINQALYNKVTLSSQKYIEIISSTDPNTKLAKLNVSFKVSGSEIDYVSTKHLLGRLETASVSIAAEDTHQCFLTTPTTTPEASKTCSIFPFGSAPTTLTGARYHKQIASDLLKTASTGTLTQHHNFVIQHETPLTKTNIDAKKTLYLKKLTNDALSGDGKLENLVPVIVQGTTNKKAFILSETPSYSIIVKKTTALESSKSISHTNSTKNYKCKLSSPDAFNCDLVDLGLSESKTSIDIAGIKNTDLTSALSIEHPESTIKFFKLDVPLTSFQQITAELATPSKKIEIVDAITPSTKIGEVVPLFAIDDNNVVRFDKSSFLVKKAVISGEGIAADATFEPSKTHYCSFSTTDVAAENPQKCELIDLGSTVISPSTAITYTPTTHPLDNKKHYLVKFIDESNNPISVAQDTKGANNMLFLQEHVDDSTKKLLAKFNNQDIQEALVVEGTTSKKYLFILAE